MSIPALADLTTLRVGGRPDGIVTAGTTEQLVAAVQLSAELSQPLLVVGGGSNLVVADSGFAGTAVLVRSRGVTSESRPDGDVALTVAAGEPWDDFVRWTLESGLVGLEALSGIPGSVGATPIQNVGAYGCEVATHIEAVDAVHRYTGELRTFTQEDLAFGYRTSIFKQRKDVFVVTSVHYVLKQGTLSRPVNYAELATRLGVDVGAQTGAHAVREAVLALRTNKGMVLDDADHDTWSVGSFFTNPLVSLESAAALPADAPRWPQADGLVKVSAAWLIEQAGFHKGYGTGSARLSSKHVLAITNANGAASAADVVLLARAIRDGVYDKYGITLDAEPALVGVEL